MYLDKELQLSASQAVTADALSTDVLDLAVAGRALGNGEPLAILLNVEVAADFTTGDETYEFKIQTDDASNFPSATDVAAYTKTAAQLAAGTNHILPLPAGISLERYLALYFNVGGTSPSVTVSAWLIRQADAEKYKAYANASRITG